MLVTNPIFMAIAPIGNDNTFLRGFKVMFLGGRLYGLCQGTDITQSNQFSDFLLVLVMMEKDSSVMSRVAIPVTINDIQTSIFILDTDV